jgi:isoleucyl-tRNA synthetase
MEPWYMESVWWVFKTIFEKDLVYRGFKVSPALLLNLDVLQL